jgi:catechol 2,3-dioxygenase-like lactoylglutathione lyase family enzyme
MKPRAFLGRVAALVIFVCLTGTAQQPERNAPPPLATRGAFFALVVTDMNASLRWYESELGLRVIKQGKSPRVAAETAVLAGQNFFVELIHYTDRALPGRKIDDSAPAAGPLKVGGILDPPVFDALAKRLESHGLEVRIFDDKEMAQRSFIVRDNDGNLIQFFAGFH